MDKLKSQKGKQKIKNPKTVQYLKDAGESVTGESDTDVLGYRLKDYRNPNSIAFEHLYGNESNITSNSIFNNLFEVTQLNYKTLASNVFELTVKTLNSYRQASSKIPMRVRELSIKLTELYTLGSRVFGSTDNFNVWLKKPSYGLGGMVPLQLLNTITGIDMIFDELVSIEFGTTA